VWIEIFRRPARLQLESVAELEEVVTCLPIIQEVLQGFRDEAAHRVAHRAMLSFPCIENPLRREVFLEAAQLFRGARRAGLTVRSGTDCLIAACALRHQLAVAHHDRDFDNLARVSPLAVKRVRV
jgi:predicted nucleic acid-binding protein